MKGVHLIVALAFLVMAVGRVTSFPAVKSSVYHPSQTVPEIAPVQVDYDYNRAVIYDPNYYPDYDSYNPDDSIASPDGDAEDSYEYSYDPKFSSYEDDDDPSYYPDDDYFDEEDYDSKSREDDKDDSKGDSKDYEKDPTSYPDEDDNSVEDYDDDDDDVDDDDYEKDPSYYPDADDNSVEDYDDDDDDSDDDDYEKDPSYYPDADDNSVEDYDDDDVDLEDDDSYEKDPSYYPDADENSVEDYDDDDDDLDDDDSYEKDPSYYPDADENSVEDYDDDDDDLDDDDYEKDPSYYPDTDDNSVEDYDDDDDDLEDDDEEKDSTYVPNEVEDDDFYDDDDKYDFLGKDKHDTKYYGYGHNQGVEDTIIEFNSIDEKLSSVKGKRQYKGQIQQQTGYVNQAQAGYEQEQPIIHQLGGDVGVGVEPLPPVQVPDIAEGVEPISDESDEDDFLSWVGDGWGHLVNTAGKVGDRIEDTFDTIGDKVSGAVDKVQDVAGDALDKVHGAAGVAIDKIQDVASDAADKFNDAAQTGVTTIVGAYFSLKNKLPELREKIHHMFSSFNLMVQRGADYCIQHMQHTADQVREAQLLDKLQQKLKDGNEQVAAFFTILGEKVTSWAQSQGHENVDEGLIAVDSHRPQEGTHLDHTEGEGSGQQESYFPNLFQDQEVVDQMNQMVNQGIVTQEEIDVFYQQTVQTSHHQQQDQAIQVQSSHSRRRHLRSRITVV